MTTAAKLDAGAAEHSSVPLLMRLALMMFLQYFVQGCYLPIAALYVDQTLGFSAGQVGIFVAALAVGPILAPFVIGQIVDRAFSTERVMAFCHLVGGLLMLALYYQTGAWPVIVLGTLYSVLYVPTMMLSNSLAFQHLRNSEMEFPWIRLFGTIGFIVPAFIIELWWLRGLEGTDLARARGIAFALSGLVGIAMSLYCLTLPHTPPQRDERHKYAPGVVMAMLGQRDFMVIVVVTFFICIGHQYFFVFNSVFLRDILHSGGWETAAEQIISSIGQWCEILVMAVLGFMLRSLGYKRVLILGASAYMVRFLLFSLVFSVDPPFAGKLVLAGLGQALHGFCFGCFLAVGYMYVDRISPPDVRGSMQNIYGVFFVSIGFCVGGLVGGVVGDWFTSDVDGVRVRDWTGIWLSGTVLCAACVLALMIFFPNRQTVVPVDPEAA
ncbi:MAG: MFS transporter [Planctomycetes bacterium]|nr:MFS transporter [Planctomycetota bacterium]